MLTNWILNDGDTRCEKMEPRVVSLSSEQKYSQNALFGLDHFGQGLERDRAGILALV